LERQAAEEYADTISPNGLKVPDWYFITAGMVAVLVPALRRGG